MSATTPAEVNAD